MDLFHAALNKMVDESAARMPVVKRRTCVEVAPEIAELLRRIAALRAIGEEAFAEHLQEDDLAKAQSELEAAHDMRWVSDWEGDANVINGTHDLSCYRCRHCDTVGASVRERPQYNEA